MTVTEVDIIAHTDFVAVVDNRAPREGEQHGVHQLDPPAVVFDEGGQPPADSQIQARCLVEGVLVVHVISLFFGDHFQGQLVMVAQEEAPLARFWNLGGSGQNIDDRLTVFELQRHEHARHERKMKGHMKLVPAAEVLAHVRGPLVGLSEEKVAGIVFLEPAAQKPDHVVRLGKVLTRRPFPLDEIRHGVHAKAVHAEIAPELHDLPHLFADSRIIEVQIGLVAEEAVPVILLGNGVPGPVGEFRIGENDARVPIAVVAIAPHIPVAARVVA